jgi:hypothetical protein
MTKDTRQFFKFAIGDIVSHKAMVNDRYPEAFFESEEKQNPGTIDINGFVASMLGRPQRFFIVERMLQECVSGTQMFYFCRGIGQPTTQYEKHLGAHLVKFNECELVSME